MISVPKRTTGFIPYDTPSHLLMAYDEDLLEKRYSLYPWQVRIHKDFSYDANDNNTNEIDLVAANDSGKSKMIIAPCALWSTCQFEKAETVLTSASGVQLDKQTARYIKDYARRMNVAHNDNLWEIQYRMLKFNPSDSYLDLFATDESTKAEGWHSRDYNTALTLIVDEAKSVSDDIFSALDRCHDAQRILRVSSPAIGTNGYFFRAVSNSKGKVYKITAYECPHIPKEKIDKIIKMYGLYSPFTRSSIFAEFTSTEESVVINYHKLLSMIANPPLKDVKDRPLRVGCDMAAGGDENVITIFQGNEQILLRPFKEQDTVKTKNLIIEVLGSYGVQKKSEYLFFDDGHVGHSIIDMLRNEGWNIKRVINQSAALSSTKMYANRGAELWFNFANFVNNEEIILINDDVTINQLGNRYYKQSGIGSKIVLESKREAKSKGHPSPDRADAIVLAFTGLESPLFNVIGNIDSKTEDNDKLSGVITQKNLIEWMDNFKFKSFNANRNMEYKEINGSMNMLLNDRPKNNYGRDKIREQLDYVKRN